MSPVKKTPAKTSHTKHRESEGLPVPQLPDVFDEVSTSGALKTTKPLVVEVDHADIIVNDAHIDAQASERLGSVVQETTMPDPEPLSQDLPTPSEPTLPAFFTQESVSAPLPEQAPPSVEETAVLEQAVPQAFVADLHEVQKEVKGERRSLIVTVCIITGMVCIAAGLIGLYYVMTKSSAGSPMKATPTPIATPEPTIAPTPVPTPTPVAVDPALKKTMAVNVLNGTKTHGFAAKEAAVVKQAGFKIGTVGNGDPTKAGTIVVPVGDTAFGQTIADALPDLKFTITEDKKAKDVTVTLGN